MATWLDKYFEGNQGTQSLLLSFSGSLMGEKPAPFYVPYAIESFWTNISLRRDDLVIPKLGVDLQKRLYGVSPSVMLREGNNPARKVYGDQVASFSPIWIKQALGADRVGQYDLYMGEPESQIYFENIDASQEGLIRGRFTYGWQIYLGLLHFDPHPHLGGTVRPVEATINP
jgi:hypothetical protein